jgi:hypothetical protein
MNAIDYIDKRLATIDTMPDTWGSPESIELQTLLLLEIRAVLLRQTDESSVDVRLSYIRFIRTHVKNATTESLSTQLLRAGRIEELPKLLAKFRDQNIVQESRPRA